MTIKAVRGFRMRSFNYAGDITTVSGHVVAIAEGDPDTAQPVITLVLRCENSTGVTVGPGQMDVTLPRRPTAG
ncbi:hypothetical protein ND748_29515 [Frankia sp. AiPs1]|uniref:hypothetical protein n=1 Tax=Frankia sp. AiPs1 TaxID=573493 RepID=UPI002044C16E|nr:hypothetical protein [Frankia sp. AiPs1]MCM3925798.1 hypothetical protein [Frankia sp. AiPs1]